MTVRKVYLGDSVYAVLDELGAVTLTTENGLPTDPSNTIYLELETLRSLDMFRQRWAEIDDSTKEGV